MAGVGPLVLNMKRDNTMKSIVGISIAALLACTPAMAQTQMPSDRTTPGVTTEPGKSGTGTSGTSGTMSGGTNATPGNMAMSADDRLSSRIVGATIRNNNNESIGDINDLVIDTSGKVTGVVAGVGGFLGIGERRVMLGYDQLQFNRDANGRMVVVTQMTRDQLRSLPEWRDTAASTDSTSRTR